MEAEPAVEDPLMTCAPAPVKVNAWEVEAAGAELAALLPDALEAHASYRV